MVGICDGCATSTSRAECCPAKQKALLASRARFRPWSGDKTWKPRGALSRRTQRGWGPAPDTMGDVGRGCYGLSNRRLKCRYGADLAVPDWAARLSCSKCGGRWVDFVVSP